MISDTAYDISLEPREIEQEINNMLYEADKNGIRIRFIELSYPDFHAFSRMANPMQFNPMSHNFLMYNSPIGQVRIEPSREVRPRARFISPEEATEHPLYKLLKGRDGVRS